MGRGSMSGTSQRRSGSWAQSPRSNPSPAAPGRGAQAICTTHDTGVSARGGENVHYSKSRISR